VDWTSAPEQAETAIVFWEELLKRMTNALNEWCSLQNEATNAEVDTCIQAVEAVIAAMTDKRVAPRLICLVLETLPGLDILVMERKSLHFKIMGVVWKSIGKLVQGRNREDLELLNSAKLLEPCVTRMLNNVGRSKEEEKKIRAFFLSQLSKLLAERLPNRSSALFAVARGLSNVASQEPGSADTAILALSHDPESAGVIAELHHESLVRLFLSNLPDPVQVPASSLNQHFDLILPRMMNMQDLSSPEASLASILEESDIADFTLKGVSIIMALRQQPGRTSEFAQIFTRAAVQAWVIENTCRWNKGAAEVNERLVAITALTWVIDPHEVVSILGMYGPIQLPLSLVDWARISFLRYVPNVEWISSAKALLSSLNLGSLSEHHPDHLKREGLLLAFLELAIVQGKMEMKFPGGLDVALLSMDAYPNLALEALKANAHAFTSLDLLFRTFDVCRPHYRKCSGLPQFLRSLKGAPCLLHSRTEAAEPRLLKEFTELLTVCTDSGERLVREETYSGVADLMSVVQMTRLRELIPSHLKQEFVDFLRSGRQSSVAVSHGPFLFTTSLTSATGLPHDPPSRIDAGEEELENSGGGGDVRKSFESMKRLLSTVPLQELDNVENKLLQMIREERARRGV